MAALRNQPVNLYSDLLLHDMGPGWPTASARARPGPGSSAPRRCGALGQRIFFLHDGRTSDLVEAIQDHQAAARINSDASEANAV